jgi:hypothetical protein
VELITLQEVASLHELDRSFLARQITKWEFKTVEKVVGGRHQIHISITDYKFLVKNNFRDSEVNIISSSEIPLKVVQKELVLDRRNISHFLNKVGIEKMERHDGVNRKTFFVITKSDYEKLKLHRLATSKSKTKEKIAG